MVTGLVLCPLIAAAASRLQPTGVDVPLGFEALRPCPEQRLHVEELHRVGAPGCDLEGSSLIFPGGTAMTIAEVGGVLGEQPNATAENLEMMSVNWGVPGVGAALIRDGRAIKVWATSDEALKLQWEALRVDGFA